VSKLTRVIDRAHGDCPGTMTQPDQAAATADLGAVCGTPTFFINGQRHYGSYDVDSLKQAVRTARALAAIAA